MGTESGEIKIWINLIHCQFLILKEMKENMLIMPSARGWVSTGGEYVGLLEKKMAGFLKTGDVAVCQSGTAGLHLSLIEAGVVPGDMVIVPTLTFIAEANPIKYQFAEPVFIDCDDSLCIDLVKIESFCREECVLEAGKDY